MVGRKRQAVYARARLLGIASKGRALLLGQAFAGLNLGVMALGPPFWGAALAAVGWGVGGAFAINAGRTLFQEHASEAHRGRVLSVYTLAILGAGPVGAQLSGFLSENLGTLTTLATYCAAMSGVIALSWLFSSVTEFD